VKTPDRALALLRTKGDKRLVTTDESRAATGHSVQQWQRLVRAKGFPPRTRVGRVYAMNAHALADFLEHRNAVEAGMTLTEAADYCRMSTYTLSGLIDAGKFVPHIGHVHSRPRYARADVEAWQAKRLGGLEPPPAPNRKSRKKK